MERERVVCPSTGTLEEIEFERTPFGIVITNCSRFRPRAAIRCVGKCAARIDRRLRRTIEDRTERVLVVYGGPGTRSIAEAIARALERDGLIVELADAETRRAPPPLDYDGVVIGSSVSLGTYRRPVRDYIARHRNSLAAMPAFFFAVGRRARVDDAAQVARRTGWQPLRATRFVRPNRIQRWLGSGIDDEAQVREFAIAIGDDVPALERQ